MQEPKTPPPILVRPSGRLVRAKLVQLTKALVPILVSPLGRLVKAKLEQSANA